MSHVNRMVAHHIVNVVAIERPFVFELRVVIHDATDPMARRRLRRLSGERLLDVIDAPQIDVDADRFLGEQRVRV